MIGGRCDESRRRCRRLVNSHDLIGRLTSTVGEAQQRWPDDDRQTESRVGDEKLVSGNDEVEKELSDEETVKAMTVTNFALLGEEKTTTEVELFTKIRKEDEGDAYLYTPNELGAIMRHASHAQMKDE